MLERPSALRFVLLSAVYAVHVGMTALAFVDYSLVGIFEQGMLNSGTRQVFSDLSIALVFVSVWLVHDARARGVAAWPWILATLVFGSLSPGLYLLVRERAFLRSGAMPTPALS